MYSYWTIGYEETREVQKQASPLSWISEYSEGLECESLLVCEDSPILNLKKKTVHRPVEKHLITLYAHLPTRAGPIMTRTRGEPKTSQWKKKKKTNRHRNVQTSEGRSTTSKLKSLLRERLTSFASPRFMQAYPSACVYFAKKCTPRRVRVNFRYVPSCLCKSASN